MYVTTSNVGFTKEGLYLNKLISLLQGLSDIFSKGNTIYFICLGFNRVFHVRSFVEF